MERLNDFEKQQMKDAIIEEGFGDRRGRLWKKRPLAIAVVIFVFISAGAYAVVGGGFEFFRDELEVPLIDLVTSPLEGVYAEDQGIRIEIVGVEWIKDIVLLYFTMQDVTGEDRLTGNQSPDIHIIMNGRWMATGGRSARHLHFNEDTNTLYFELQVHVGLMLTADALVDADTLEIIVSQIYDSPAYVESLFLSGEWRMEVAMADAYHPTLTLEDIRIPDRDFHIDYMVISALGVHASGIPDNFDVGEHAIFDFDVLIEVNFELVDFRGSQVAFCPDRFDFFLYADGPLDIEEVTAVIINGYRIEVHE